MFSLKRVSNLGEMTVRTNMEQETFNEEDLKNHKEKWPKNWHDKEKIKRFKLPRNGLF
jgi:hypothetical protein